MKTTKTIAVMVALLLASACATPVTQEKAAAADYGPPPPANYEEIIKARIDPMLVDPASAIYEMDKPRKGYTQKSPQYRTLESYGWVVCGTVNSKNRMGGYAGRRPFFALFQGPYIAEFIVGEATSRPEMINKAIQSACSRVVS